MKSKKIRIGFLGMGTVAQGVWKHLSRQRERMDGRFGASFELSKACVRKIEKKRSVSIPKSKLTLDPSEIVSNPDIDLVCELMGGVDEALPLTLEALKNGKTVVSANKALVCMYGEKIFETAKKHGGAYFFEASVAGGIPVIKILREGLVANRFPMIYGILNGTCNYILTRMERENAAYESILADARRLGYVEADESLDIDGWDSAHKIAILAHLAHGVWINPKTQMLVSGIRDVKLEDMLWARDFNFRIKLLASVRRDMKTGAVFSAVYPALLPIEDVLANVNGVYNGVSFEGDLVGRTVHIGRGAGQDATASAVIADISDAVKFLRDAGEFTISQADSKLRLAKASEIKSAFYARISVKDEKGVLAKVSECLSACGISIELLKQIPQEAPDGKATGRAWLILTSHETTEENMGKACRALAKLKVVHEKPFVLRIFKNS